jgi:transcriptional regulator with GAF, ATPase, and Fis domain
MPWGNNPIGRIVSRRGEARLIVPHVNWLTHSRARVIFSQPRKAGIFGMGATQVTSSRKGAKSQTHGRKSRSTGTKATRGGRIRKPRDLEQQLEKYRRELAEAREQQTATSEVLQVISSSPGDSQPVFNTMLENALRICEAKFGVLFHIDEEGTYPVAMLNLPPVFDKYCRQRERRKPRPDSDLDVLCKSRQVVHTIDMLETSSTAPPAKLGGARTQLAVPMLKDGKLVGAIVIYRQEVRAFTEKQIDLVKNFATQAVIAIENARLFNELRQRTDDLSEALEQQTATSDVLGIISSSPGQLEPVFRAMLSNALRICEAKFGNLFLYEGGVFREVSNVNTP